MPHGINNIQGEHPRRPPPSILRMMNRMNGRRPVEYHRPTFRSSPGGLRRHAGSRVERKVVFVGERLRHLQRDVRRTAPVVAVRK